MLAGGALSLALRLVLDALAGAMAFAGACRLLKLDEYLYLEGLLWGVLGRVMSIAGGKRLYRAAKRSMRG